jgi:hypothetical protein
MPIQAIPWLAGALSAMFVSVFSFVTEYMTKRLAVVVAAVVVIGVTTVALFTAINLLLTGIAVAIPANYGAYAGMFLPSNLDECITAVASARVLKYGYDWQIKIIQYKLF